MRQRPRPRTEHPITESSDHSVIEEGEGPTEIKPFFLPRGWFHGLLTLPAQIWFAISGLLGIAQYARQVVRVPPARSSALIKTSRGKVGLAEWVDKEVPSLKGTFLPTWWLPKSVMATRAKRMLTCSRQRSLADHVLCRRKFPKS